MKLSRLGKTILLFVCFLFEALFLGIIGGLFQYPVSSILCVAGLIVAGVVIRWIFDEKHF